MFELHALDQEWPLPSVQLLAKDVSNYVKRSSRPHFFVRSLVELTQKVSLAGETYQKQLFQWHQIKLKANSEATREASASALEQATVCGVSHTVILARQHSL